MTEHFNSLVKNMESLSRKFDASRVFDDLLTMVICSHHTTNIKSRLQEKDEANEAFYMSTIEKYRPEELDLFAQACAAIQLNVLDNPYSDILGEYFMQNITRGQNGQYFTPEPVCDMMAVITGGEAAETGNRVLDPASGSGRMLLSYAKQSPDNYFFAADLSQICAKMSVVNFLFNGLRGEVACMNSLSYEFFQAWHVNMDGIGITPIEKEQSQIWTKPPPPKPDMQKKKGKRQPSNISQLELF